MLEGFFQRSVVWVVLAAGLDDGGAEPLFHMARQAFCSGKEPFCPERSVYGGNGAERHEGYGAVVAPFADHEPVRTFSGCLGTGSAFPSADPGGTASARRLVSAQRGIKPGVEYFHSGYLVDDGAEVFCLFAGGVQFFLGNDGGEAFILSLIHI